MRVRLLFAVVFFVLVGLMLPANVSASTGADLSLAVTGPSTIEQYSGGQTPTSYGGGNYRVTYTNTGPDVATNVILDVRFGAGVSWDLFDTNMDCVRTSTGASCDLGTLQPGSSATRTFALYPGTVGTWKVMYNIHGDQLDTKQNNNTVVTRVTVIPPTHADLILDPSGTSYVNTTAGQPVYLREFLTNAGPSDATNTNVIIQLPSGVSFEPSGSDPNCTAAGQTVTCAIGTFPYGSTNFPVSYYVTAAQPGTYPIRITTSADQPDPNSANSTETIYLQVS
jgi:uncharacterized repeat protein (TIGR01451 family)